MYNIDEMTEAISRAISELQMPGQPAGLYDPIRYILDGGGKRLRPLLTLASCRAVGGNQDDAMPQALGIEMFHNFTLLHDDVMDRAEVRRGRPTVHRRWNEATAILSGDTMLTLATQLICRTPSPMLSEALALFNRTAVEIYEGQQYDMDFERESTVTEEQYIEMIRLKTSVLLGCACAMGALIGGGSPEIQRALYRYGEHLGLAFQLRDDMLDTYGDPIVFGKEIGGDIINEKKTWLLITAMNETDEVAKVFGEHPDDGVKIARVTEIYNRLDLPRRCNELIVRYSREAISCIEDKGLPRDAVEFYTNLAQRCIDRNH